jgi:alpha-tubulin suppressor-like RCC1 family protein
MREWQSVVVRRSAACGNRTAAAEMGRCRPARRAAVIGGALVALLPSCSLINDFSVRDGGPDAGASDAHFDAPASVDAFVDSGACIIECAEPTPLCDPASGECVECLAPSDCDDNNWCTTDRCDLRGTCSHPVVPTCATDISASAEHTCASLASGAVNCWGNNMTGQLGDGRSGAGTGSLRSVRVPELSNATSVAIGYGHSCALRADGTVACWGWNRNGQLGDGSMTDRASPADVTGIGDAQALEAGDHYNCVLRSSGQVSCWGFNDVGQLGNGRTDDSATPVAVLDLDDAVELSVGINHACARRATGELACWGEGTRGQLGDGTMLHRSRPVSVPDFPDVPGVAAGGFHSCALLADERIACWGANANGELGDGSTIDSVEPLPVPGLTGLAEVAAGLFHTCARESVGRVHCWGENSRGQLGEGAGGPVPHIVSTIVNDAVQLSLGYYYSCAIRADGSISCWGANTSGQLGTGNTTGGPTPMAVVGLR